MDTDDEVERLGYRLDEFALSRPAVAHPASGIKDALKARQ